MLLLNEIKLKIPVKDEESQLQRRVADFLCVNVKDITSLQIVKKSLDARKKPELFYIYSVAFSIAGNEQKAINRLAKKGLMKYEPKVFEIEENIVSGDRPRPIIVGTGPAGLFAAYYLCKAGMKPIIIERGSCLEQRKRSVEHFWESGELDENSNVQFGEGGAGTFSDGKLNTGIKDKYGHIKAVLDIFVSHGAPADIAYLNKPHIGTDVLFDVIRNIRNDIIQMGGEYHFNTLLTDVDIVAGRVTGVRLKDLKTGKEYTLNTDKLLLAIGHSARDTFEMLLGKNVPMANKPFAIGVRVMHKQRDINIGQYGLDADYLPAADYKLTYTAASGKGVYSFCMCPGGYVVNASSENGRTCVNGMSYRGRDSQNANSAIVMTIDETDYGYNILDGMRYQRDLEKAMFDLGNGKLVIQRYGDLVNDITSIGEGEIKPVVKGLYQYGNLCKALPKGFVNDFVEAMEHFGHLIKGYAAEDVLVCGLEARTSSPIRILRNESFESDIAGLYPIGEGAGYAGGITSAAVDGLKVAKVVANKERDCNR